jgi:hypothetical protein
LNDHSALSREPIGSGRGQRLLAGPPDDHQVFTDPHPPQLSQMRVRTFARPASGTAKARLKEPSTGSNCRSCRPVPCAPLSSGDQGCQDGQKTARGRHFLRPPFCRIKAMVDPALQAVKSQVASSCCTGVREVFGQAEATACMRVARASMPPWPDTGGPTQAARHKGSTQEAQQKRTAPEEPSLPPRSRARSR